MLYIFGAHSNTIRPECKGTSLNLPVVSSKIASVYRSNEPYREVPQTSAKHYLTTHVSAHTCYMI